MTFTIDETKSMQENFNLFLEMQRDPSYTLGDFTGTAQGDMELYTELKIKVEQERENLKAWEEAWNNKEIELRQAHDVEIQQFLKDKEAARDSLTLPQ